MLEHFAQDIGLQRLPGKAAIENFMAKHRFAEERTWKKIKDLIRNHMEKSKVYSTK